MKDIKNCVRNQICGTCQQSGQCTASVPDPRESMRRLWRPLQWLLTELTGKALPGQKPPFRWSPAGRFVLSLAFLALGLSLSYTALDSGGVAWVLLLPGWLLTVSAMRTWQTSFVHHAAHGNFIQPPVIGSLLADALSTMVWIQPLSGYEPDHALHHAKIATKYDADLRFLIALGFSPGRPIREYWAKLFFMMVSPSFHLKYALFRLRANFVTAPPLRLTAACIWTLAALGVTIVAPLTALVLWLIPAWPLYQIAGLLQLLTEHNWVRIGDGRDQPRVVLSRLTNARFIGDPLPDAVAPWTAQAGWWLRLMFLHLPQRLSIAQGDLPNHDWHHREPKGDWANAAYSRSLSLHDKRWPTATELWGTRRALEQTFRLLAALPATADLGVPPTYGELSEGLLAM